MQLVGHSLKALAGGLGFGGIVFRLHELLGVRRISHVVEVAVFAKLPAGISDEVFLVVEAVNPLARRAGFSLKLRSSCLCRI
jgi:hypothetical protein